VKNTNLSGSFLNADTVIAGAGIMGVFTALYLARKGQSVILLDKGPIFRAATGRTGGGVRQQYRHAAETSLSMESVKIWADLSDDLGMDIEYRRTGNLKLVRKEEEVSEVKKRVQREKAQGLEVFWWEEKDVRDYLPVLNPDLAIQGGTFCPSDGTANALLLAGATRKALQEAGVRLRTHEPARRILVSDGHAIGIETDGSRYLADTVVNTAGAWAQDLIKTVGLDIPLIYRKSQIVVTEPLPRVIPCFISFEHGYCRQAVNGNLHLGVRGYPVQNKNTDISPQAFTDVGVGYIEYFPFLRRTLLIRGFAGITTWSPDHIPIIDRAPGFKNLFIAAGFSGHGFCLGPIVGKLLAEWIINGGTSMDLSAFSWSRFSN
jgi:sarcosine oxidase, subunit beta